MGLDQRLIQQAIDNGEILHQCCVSKRIKSPRGEFVGFHFKEPYHLVSHTYEPVHYEETRALCKLQRYLRNKSNGKKIL